MTDNEELKSKSGDKGEAPSDGQDGCMAKKEADKHTPVLDNSLVFGILDITGTADSPSLQTQVFHKGNHSLTLQASR